MFMMQYEIDMLTNICQYSIKKTIYKYHHNLKYYEIFRMLLVACTEIIYAYSAQKILAVPIFYKYKGDY